MGRGRATRFGIVLGAALALALAGFFALAPAAVRRHALGPGETRTVIPSPSGGVLIAVSARTDSGCLVDAETGRVERILPPPVESAIVSPDGRVAVVTWAGSFGAMADRARVEFFDARGRRVGAGASLMDGVAGHWGTWAGSAVALAAVGARSSRIAVVDGGTGAVRIVDVPSTWGRLSLVGPTLDGRLFVAIGPEEPEAADARGPVRGRAQTAVAYDVVEVDILEGRLGAKPILRELGVPWRAPHLLSPSGRYWLVDRGAGICDARPILELENGLDLGPPSPLGRRTWLSGDVLAWLETSGDTTWLFVARPGEDPKPVRGWRTAFVQLQPSPDRALLLVHARGSARHSDLANRCPGPSASRVAGLVASGPVPQTGIYDPGRGVWSDLPAWEPAEGLNFDCERVWAGPRTLARTGPGFLALEDIDRPGAIREVLGRSP